MSSLTDEQRKMIEEKKKAAQAKLVAKFSQRSTIQPIENNNQCPLSITRFATSPNQNKKTIRINYNSPQNTKSSSIVKAVRGTCELTSKDRFTVHVVYHQQLIDTFKTITSKNYGKQSH